VYRYSLERGKEHGAAGRDDEAHFDYARAVTGEGQHNPEVGQNNPQRLNQQQMEEAKDLLQQHHRKHSVGLYKLNVADP
jgi:hypothetical protein